MRAQTLRRSRLTAYSEALSCAFARSCGINSGDFEPAQMRMRVDETEFSLVCAAD